MNKEERIKEAAVKAQNMFWDIVAEEFPEITTGDFPPDATFKFDKACEDAIKTWVEYQTYNED